MKILKRNDRPACLHFPIYLFLATVILTAGFMDVAAANELTAIKILDAVEIDGRKIHLGDIAQIDSHDLQLIHKLKDVEIGTAPLPGRSRVIEAEFIQLRLKQNDFDVSTLNVHGSQTIKITRSHVEINEDEIRDIVSNFIYNQALRGKKSARITALRVPKGIILSKGHITYRVSPPKHTDYLGKVPLSVEFSVDGKRQKKVWATVTIEMMVEVVVSKKPLRKHKPLDENDIELRKMDLADLPSNVITDPQAVLGKRTRRAIGSKTILRTDLIELPPIVKRGDIVVIVAESNGFRITALGKAKSKGRLGERIPVENFDSKKILYGRVVDSRTVEIEF